MANAPNVELEAAKFLHKLIQESKDEPTKLATKLYVILQHMRSSGKENSMPYQVISRAMETVIKQHNLDVEALMSSRLPVAAGAQVGDSSSSQLAGSSQRAGVVNNVKASLPEMGRPDGHASSRGQVGPPSGGQDIYHGKASHTSVSTNLHGATPGVSGSYPAIDSGISNPMHFGSSSYENHGLVPKMLNEKVTESYSATPSFDLSASKSTAGKAMDHEGGTNTVANKTIQGGVVSSATETSMLKSVAPRDTGKSPASSVPFKEQQLRQLRAQCLVFLAFRNGLMPKKLHLEIALGNILPRDDGQRRDLSVNDPSSVPEVTRPFGRVDTTREAERMPPGSSSAGILVDTNLSKGAENSAAVDDKSGPATDQFENVENGKHHFTTKKPEAEETTEFQSSAPRGLRPDANTRGLAVSYNRNDFMNTGQQLNGTSNQASFCMGTGHARNDNAHNQSPAECNFHATRFAESNLPSSQSREQWTSISSGDGQSLLAIPVKDGDAMTNNLSQVQESDPEEEDNSISTDRPPSPKYTTVDKWILDRQKRKILTEEKWAQKQQKTEKKIAACFDKLKESVSASEDIFAKTKSVIELKKLQLLELQRRLRSDILNDFFKPIATDMDRLKSIKKHRIGRKSKQLERYEQRMKEERQKRFRERQKEFFGEIDVHRERLEDIFKMRRERWKGFNRYVREFHKRKERIHREKIDRIQREKINLLKINDVEGYLRMVQDAKSDRVKQLLKETEKYLSKLGAKLQEAKVITRRFETEMDESRSTGFVEKTETAEDEDDTDQAKHYLESNEKYYMMAHSIKENITEQPACLVGGKLREYQMNGLRWLVSLYNNHLNGILADEMGLGKTVQVISLICYLMENKNDRGPFLVVVPSSVLSGWESEISFWAPSIHKIVYSGPPEERRRLFKEQIVHQKFNVLLTTYEYLMNKHDRPKLSKVHWHYIIIDEGHRIKNASCKLNADLKHYRSNHRLLLTGTPLQNNLEELWALLNFLLPNIFNSSEDFSQWFNKPFESNGDNSPDEALLSEEENLLIINRLHQVLRPFVLRRLKHKVENELPEKIERLVRCEASAYQKLLIKRVEENLGAIGTSKARSVHNSVMELRNICNHPYLSQLHVEEVHDLIPKHYLPNIVRLCGKLEMLDRLLPKLKATDHRVLLFSTMTRLLDVMEDYLSWKQYKYLRLDGHTSGGERGALIDLFNQPNSPFFIFLLSIRAGGVGVNLQAADTVIIFDTDWNPQVDLQAQARAHRIGQKKDVLVLRLETVQTVEEQVRASAEHKLGVANQSITAGFFDNNTSAEDRREYLESLLRECKKEEAAPVLDDDALNDLIARSESEIDIFESVDKRRREEEMAAWKQLFAEWRVENSLLPPRLLTDDDLKAFYEAMKITEAPHPGVASATGVKRKGEYLVGLDTQQYGRGKRAREVRSYEEQWSEEEFERMCQVDSSGSPNYKDPNMEKKFVSITSGSVVATGLKLEAALPQPLLQPTFEPAGQQVKEVTPPIKRGRGRPKRAVTAVNIPAPGAPAPVAPAPVAPAPVAPAPVASLPVTLAAPPGVTRFESGSMLENTSSPTMLHGPDSLTSNTPLRSITGNINQVGVPAAPSLLSSSLPSVGPPPQSIHPSTPGQGRGRGRKAQTGEAARRRGRKQNLVLQDVPVISVPSESEKREMERQGVVIPSSSTVFEPTPVSSSATPGEASKEPSAVSPIPVIQSFSIPQNVNMGVQQKSNLSASTVPDHESFPGFPAVISTGKEDHGMRIASASELSTSLPSVIPALQIALSQSEPKQGKGRGRKPQVGGEAPRRRGKRLEPATTVVISGSADQDLKSIEPAQKRSRVSAGRRVSARNKHDNEPQIMTHSIQLNTAEATSDPAMGQIHNGEQENKSLEKRDDAKSESQVGTNPPVELVSVVVAEQDVTITKEIPHGSPLSEIIKDASSRNENIDYQAIPPSSSNEVSKGPSLPGKTGSAFESTVENSVFKNGETVSQPRQEGMEKDPGQLMDAIQSADPSTGKMYDVENQTTATKEIQCQMVLPETAVKEYFGSESRDTSNLPSSSKACIEDVKDQLLDDSHASAPTVGSEVPLNNLADEMPESKFRKENGENAILQDKMEDEMHETQARKGNGGKTVRVDNAINDTSESQARNKVAGKEGQMQNPMVDRTSGVLALSAPTSCLSSVQSDGNLGKLTDQENEDPALVEVLVSNLPTTESASPSVNNALNSSRDLSAKEERLHQENEDPASCDVSGSKVDLPASVDTCYGDVKDHIMDDPSAPTLRSTGIADSTTDKMCEGPSSEEYTEMKGLKQNICVYETLDMLPPSEATSGLSIIRADSHAGKLEDEEKEDQALTEVLVSSFPTSEAASSETVPPTNDSTLNKSVDLSAKEDISDQDSKISAPCDAPRLNSELLASTESCGGAVMDQLDDTTKSALKSSAIVDSITNKMCKDQDNEDDVEREGQVQNAPADETSGLLAPDAPVSGLSLLEADNSGKQEDQEMEDRNLPIKDDAPPNSNIAFDNSAGDLSGKEDRIDQDETMDDPSASTSRSSNMVDGTTDETCEAEAVKGDVEKAGLMQNALVGGTADMLAPSKPASDFSSVPADSPLREVEGQEKEDPAPTEVLLPRFPTSETAPSNIGISLVDPEDLSAKEDTVNQESKDSAPCDVPGLNSHLLASVEMGNQHVHDQSLDNNSDSTLRFTVTVDSTIDEMCESQASKNDAENGQVQNLSVDRTSVLPDRNAHGSGTSLVPVETHLGKLEDPEKEHPTQSEVHVSDLPIMDSASPSINTALENSGDVSEKEDRVNQESKVPSPCDFSGSDIDLPASVDTCCGDIKDQPPGDNCGSTLRSSVTVDSSADEPCEGQANKEDMEKEGQVQNTVVDLVPLAAIAPASDLLPVAADGNLGKMEDQEKEESAPIEVLVPSLPTMDTAPSIPYIPLNNSEDPSAKEDIIDEESKDSVPYDAPGLRLDLPASLETCGEDVKAQTPDDTSASHFKSAAITNSSKISESHASEEEGEKECHEQNPSEDETTSMSAPVTPASDSFQVDSHSEKTEDRDKKHSAVNEVLTSSLPMGTSFPSGGIAVSSSGDPSREGDKTDDESKDSSPCHIPELKPDVPASIHSCTEDVKVQSMDGTNAFASTLSSACAVDSTKTESCKGQEGEENGGKVGEEKESAEELSSDLLTGGGYSHCGESEEQEKKEPAPIEVLDSSTLPSTEPASTASDVIAPNNSEEQNRVDKEHKDSALDDSDVATNESSPKHLLSTSPTTTQEASSLGSPEKVSAKEVEKNTNTGCEGTVNPKLEATEIDNTSGDGGNSPTS